MGSKVKTPKSSSFHLLSVHHWLCLYLYQINIHCLLGGSTVAVVFPCIPIFLGVRFWWSNYVNDHILLQSPNIIYTFTVFIYLCIYLNLAGILMATVLLNETPHFPVSPQPTWAVSTTCWNITKDMVGRWEFPLQTTEPPCKVHVFFDTKKTN